VGRRRPHLSRTTIGVLVALTVWVVILAALLKALGHPRVRGWLAQVAATRIAAAVGMPVAVEDVRISLYPPRIALLGVRLGERGKEVLTARVAETAVTRFDLGDRELVLSFLHLAGVKVAAALPEGGGERRGLWVRVVVRQLEVEDLEVERLVLPDGIVFRASGVEARWSGTTRRPVSAATFHADTVTIQVPGLAPISGAVSGRGRLTPEGWEIGRVRGAGAGWRAEGQARAVASTVTAEGTVGFDLATLDAAVGAAAGLAGWVEGGFRLTAAPALRLAMEVTAPRVEAAGFSITDLRGEVEVSGDGVEGSLQEGRFAGGSVEGSYRLTGLAPPWRHRVAMRGRGLDLALFLRQLGVGDGGMAAACDVNAELTWDGVKIGRGSGTAVADLNPTGGEVPVGGRVVAQLVTPGVISFDARALRVAGGSVSWDGTLTLGSWVPRWQVRGEGVPVATVARLLRDWVGSDVFPPELVGETAFDLVLRGPFEQVRVIGDAALAPVAFGPLEADSLVGHFAVVDGTVTVEDGVVQVGGGTVSVSGRMLLDEALTLDLRFHGRGVPLSRLARWGGIPAPVEGRVGFAGTLNGPLSRPRGRVGLTLEGVSVAGADLGAGQGQVVVGDGAVRLENLEVGPLSADVDVDFSRCQASVVAELKGFALERLSPPLAGLLGGALDCSLRGAFPFDSPGGRLLVSAPGGASGELELNQQGLRLELERPGAWRVAGALAREGRGFRGSTSFSVRSWRMVGEQLGAGTIPFDGTLQGQGEVVLAPSQPLRVGGSIEQATLVLENGTASLVRPAPFSVTGSAVSVGEAMFTGPDVALSLTFQRGPSGELAGRVTGELPAELLGLVWHDAQPRGRVHLEAELGGTDATPEIVGKATIANGAMTIPGVPGRVTGIDGAVTLVNGSLQLDGVRFVAAGGHGTCSGTVTFLPEVELDLAVDVASVRWPLAEGLAPALSGSVRLVGPLAALVLSGSGTVEPTSYRQNVSLQSLVLDALLGAERLPAAEEAPVSLNLAVRVPGTFLVENATARLAFEGELRIVGTSSLPGVLGELTALPGGEITLSGVRYDVDHAIVTFADPRAIAPYLDVLIRGTVDYWEVTAAVSGTLDRLTPTLSSNPPLPDSDILGLISSGGAVSRAGVGEGQAVAGGLLLEQLTGAVAGRARTLLDLDQLRIDPAVLSQTGDPTARVTVVKQLNPNWSVTVSTNLAANREEIVVSRWRLAPGVYLEAMRDGDGSYSMEVKWKRRY